MKLGIFDSGYGGELVAQKLMHILPAHEYIVVNDRIHAPYGERSYDDIRRLTDAAIQPLLTTCDLVVIACNTATVATINFLRTTYPDKIFIGFEPMIKTAAKVTHAKHFTLLATRATQFSMRTHELMSLYARNMIIDRPETHGWAKAIDAGETNTISLDAVAQSVASGSDVIIIGCTHYIALIPRLKEQLPHVAILEPTKAVARQIITLTGHSRQQ